MSGRLKFGLWLGGTVTVLSIFSVLAPLSQAQSPKTIKPGDFFPIGTWYVGHTANDKDFQDIANRGMDTVVAFCSHNVPSDSSQPGSVRSVLALGEKYHLKIILMNQLMLSEFPSMKIEALLKKDYVSRRLEPYVKEAVRHPSLVGYYLIDEPSTPEGFKKAELIRQVLEKLDPRHFSYTAGQHWHSIPPLLNATNGKMQVAAPEAYPLWGYPYTLGAGNFHYAWFTPQWYGNSDPKKVVDLADAYEFLYRQVGDKAVIWPFIQAFQEKHPPPDWYWRLPAPEELRCMTHIALAKGAKGVFFFAYDFLLTDPASYPVLMPEIERLSRRLHTVGPVLLPLKRTDLVKSVAGGGSEYYSSGIAEGFVGPDSERFVYLVNRNCRAQGKQIVSATIEVQNLIPDQVRDVENRFAVAVKKKGTNLWDLQVRLDPGDGVLLKVKR